MRVIGTMAARNEDWVLGLSARAALLWCDELVILDHASTDDTRAIVDGIAAEDRSVDRICRLTVSDPVWAEMSHRQMMLEAARRRGATHIVYIDADEVLTGNLLPRIRSLIECAVPGFVLQLPWLQLRGSLERFHTSGPWGDCSVSLAFADDQRYHWAARNGYDFHQRHPMGLDFFAYRPLQREDGGLMHLQMVSDRRLRAKQALYKMTEVIRWPGRKPVEEIDTMYSRAVFGQQHTQTVPGLVSHFGVERAAAILRAAREANPSLPDKTVAEEFGRAPAEWWAPYLPWLGYLDLQAEPWQLAECRRLWQLHGPEKFAGLDLFGVCE